MEANNIFSPVVIILLIILVIVVILLSFLNRQTNVETRPFAACYSTATDGFIDGKPTEYYIFTRSFEQKLVPMTIGKEVLFVQTTQDKLLETTQDLYRKGVRVFFGESSTNELMSIGKFIESHPDAMWVSTSSTAPLPESVDKRENVFRLAMPDIYAVPLFTQLVNKHFAGKDVIVLYNKDNHWSKSLAQLFKLPSYAIQDGIPPLTSNNVVLYFEELASDFLKNISLIPKDVDVVVGDYLAFHLFTPEEWKTIGRPIYALTSFNGKDFNFALNVYKTRVSPFIANILPACWLASDVYGAIKEDPERTPASLALEAFGPDGAYWFEKDGDSANRTAVLIKGQPEKIENEHWFFISTAANEHGFQPMFGEFSQSV